MADLLPVLLEAGLAREVASVVDGLQLPENPPARKNVHPEHHPTSLSSFYLFPQTFTNKSIHWRAVFTFCQHMMQSTTFYPAVSLQTESVRVGTESAPRHTGQFPPIRAQLSDSCKRVGIVSGIVIGGFAPGAVTCHVPEGSGQSSQLHDITPCLY